MEVKDYREIWPDAPAVTDELRLELFRKYCKQYIFYKRYKNYADCFCTSCMKRFQIYYDNMTDAEFRAEAKLFHNDTLRCPQCGFDVTAKAEGKHRNRLYEDNYISRIFPADNGNTVYILCLEIYGGYGNITYNRKKPVPIEEMEQSYKGASVWPAYIVRLRRGEAETYIHSGYGDRWYKREKDVIFEPYLRENTYSASCYFDIDNPLTVKDTFLRYSINMERLAGDFRRTVVFVKKIKYLMFTAMYPAAEMLDKIGGIQIIREIVDYDRSYKRALDLSGRTAAEVFRTDSNRAARIRQLMPSGKITLDVLKCFRKLKNYKVDDAIELCAFTQGIPNGYENAAKDIKTTGLTPTKYMNYLYKQAEKKLCCVTSMIVSYHDYIGECGALGYDVRDPQINRPSDLDAAHGRTMSAVRVIEEEHLATREKEKLTAYRNGIYKKYVSRYEYSDGNYSIIVPVSAQDIVAEGKAMHHCVAGYAERHVEGKLCILFLRKTSEPHRSLYTIEMNGEKLRQIQGYGNRTPLTPDAKEFFNAWLKWQAQPEEKKHPKNKKKKKSA